MAPVMGLLALTATPPIVTSLAGIQGGFSSLNASQVKDWERTLDEAQEKLQIQVTLRDHVRRAISTCCLQNITLYMGDDSLGSNGGANVTDTILETEVLELGLAESASAELPVPDENNRAINSTMAKATVPLNSIFEKARSSVYVIVQTKLLRAADKSLIDQRQFGYLSTPRPYMDWTDDNASRFRTELLSAYQGLASQIVEKLVMTAP